ncbi:hypothetical protein IWZ03DRAFT_181226 [Phyllosticta citriasiana]|uniref:Uncharacterized protein n=2 Tax=Phyllosticta citriasiana TaxID=595635 RepID=A0ABR1KPD2_9PEZI
MAVCGTVGATSLRGAPGAIASPTDAQNGESPKNRAAWCWISQLSSRSSCKTPRNAPVSFVEDFSPVGNGLSGCSERICTREELWQLKYSTPFIPFVKLDEGTKHGAAFRHRLGEEFGACLLGVLTFFLICGFFVAISIIPFEKTGAKWLPGARCGLYAGYIVCFMGVVALLFEWSQQFARLRFLMFRLPSTNSTKKGSCLLRHWNNSIHSRCDHHIPFGTSIRDDPRLCSHLLWRWAVLLVCLALPQSESSRSTCCLQLVVVGSSW